MKFSPFQVGDKVTPEDTWAEAMPAVPQMKRGRLYCVVEVVSTQYGPRIGLVGIRGDRRGKGTEPYWPIFAFRLVSRSRSNQREEAA